MEVSSNKLINSNLICPGSKSYANRMLFLAALSEKAVVINNIPKADDVQFFVKALDQLGFKTKYVDNCLTLYPLSEFKLKSKRVELGEGGTTIRFMMVMLASIGGEYELIVNERFLKRPLDDIKNIFKLNDVELSTANNSIKIKGKLTLEADIEVDCKKTTQFASAFLMLKKLDRIKSVSFINLESSKKYLELTDSLKLSDKFNVPADFSSLSYLVAYSLLNQDLNIDNVHSLDNYQADSILFSYIEKLGAKFEFNNKGLKVFKSDLQGHLEVDASLSLDLIPTLVYLSICSDIQLTISNLKNLEYKESNRLQAIIDCLDHFNIKYSLADTLKIYEKKTPIKQSQLTVVHDHRIVMMNYLILKTCSGGAISPIEAINKSFPEFLDIFK